MPNPIKLSDLFDFSDRQVLQDALSDIKSLEAAYRSFQQTVVNGSLANAAQQYQNLNQSIQGLIQATDQLNIANQQAQKNLVAAGAQMASYQNTINQLAAQQQALNNINNAAADSVFGLKRKLKDLEDQYNKLSQSSATYKADSEALVADIVRTKTEINTLTNALRVNISTYNAAKSSYAALDMETKKLVQDLKNLDNGLDKNNKTAEALKKQIAENTARLKEFDRQIGVNNRNVGNYTSAFNNLTGGLKGYALGLISITALTAGIKKAFEEALDFSSIKRGLDVVSKSSEVGAQNMAFLRQTANDLGIEFSSLTTNFNKFYAAATIAGYSAESARKIFLQFGNAFANIHLSTSDTNSAFLALEQIISKGKVSAEELRRQLGNVLPGAFEIAAKAAGVTTTQLDKMLKKGELLANEFLPKFANEVQKAFGESTGHIDSLQASVNRFSNAVSQGFQTEGLQKFFTTFVDGATSVVNYVRNLFVPTFEKSTKAFQENKNEMDAMENALSPLLSRYDELKKSAGSNTQSQDELKKVINQIATILPGVRTGVDEYGNALDINRQKVFEFTDAQLKLNKAMKATAVRDLQDNIKEALKSGKEAQDYLNKGQFPQFSRSRGAYTIPTIFPAGQDRAGTLTPIGRDLSAQLQDSKKVIQENAQKLLELGGDLDSETSKFIGGMGLQASRRLADISNISKDIAAKEEDAYTAFKAGNDKLRQDIIKQIADLKKQRQELISPGSTLEATPPNQPDPDAEKKAEALRKKLEREQKARIKAAADLNKAAAKEEIATAELVYARSQKTTADEIALEEKKYEIIARYADLRAKLYSKDSDDFKTIQAEKTKAEAEMLEKRAKAWDESQKRIAASDKELLEHAKATIKASGEYYDSIRQSEQADRINSVRLSVANGSMSGTRGEDTIHDINRKALEDEIDMQRYAIDQMKLQDADYYNAKKALADKERQLAQENADFEIRKAEEVHQVKQKLQQAGFEFVATLLDGVNQIQQSEYENELSNLQRKYDTDIELAGNNKNAKNAIEKRFQAEQNRIKKQEAELQKQGSIFSIGLTTAEKIVEAYPNPYLMAAAAAIGALEIGIVSSKKIPDYWKGRGDGPAELANINEKGWEFIQRGNKYMIAGGGQKTVTYLEAGDKVLTHEQSVKKAQDNYLNSSDSDAFLSSLLEGTQVSRQYEERMTNKLAHAVASSHLSQEALTEAFKVAISELPIEVNSIDDNGHRRYTRRRNSIVQELHERNKIGGRG